MHKGSFALHTCRLQLKDTKQMFTAILKMKETKQYIPYLILVGGEGVA